MKNLALVVIDVQNALVHGNPYRKDIMIQNLQTLIHAARKQDIEVIYVRHDDGVGSEFEVNTESWQIHKSVYPKEDEKVVDKQYNSAFHKTELDAYLKTQGHQNLIITGMQTEFCIDATVRSAFDLGYKVYIPDEAHSSFDNPHMKADNLIEYYNQYMWQERYAKVVNMEEAVNLIVSEA